MKKRFFIYRIHPSTEWKSFIPYDEEYDAILEHYQESFPTIEIHEFSFTPKEH